MPQAPIEAAIAFSIYVLAVELARHRAGARTFTQRAPWLIAGNLGLLHGLGFAGALSEVGLPSAEIPLVLFSFNVGIELGQLAFIAVVVGISAALGRLSIVWPRRATAAPAYAIGSLAIYWMIVGTLFAAKQGRIGSWQGGCDPDHATARTCFRCVAA